MRFFAFIAVLLHLGSIIASPEKRDVTAIEIAIRRISSALQRLDAGMRSRPNGGDLAEAVRQSDRLMGLQMAVVGELRTSAREVRRGPNASMGEGYNVTQAFGNMTGLVQISTDGWLASLPMIVAAQKQDAVLNTLMDTSEATTIFADALIGKLPYVIQAVASPQKTQFINIIEKSVAQYQALFPARGPQRGP